MIDARINGEPVQVAEGTHLLDVVAGRVERVAGVAVACNDAVVPRSQWTQTYVRDGDRIEILVAAQGG